MNDQLLRTFIALVNFDQKIVSLVEERKTLMSTRDALHIQKDDLLHEIEILARQLDELKKDVDEKELLMKILDQQEVEKKARLEKVLNAKEYASLKAEIASINEKQREHEDSLIGAWDKLDASKKKYLIEHVRCQHAINKIENDVLELDKKIESLGLRIDEQEQERGSLVSAVPAELLDNYEHMRGQVINPVVTVNFNSCSACYYPVPAQDLAILRKGKFLPCKGCYRILYIEDCN